METRGLAIQHIESYNYFVTTEIKQIVMAQSNRVITSDVDLKWRAEYTDVYFREPCYQDLSSTKTTSPQMCRIRDMTYQAAICVDVTYHRGTEVVRKKGLQIGYLPVMLRSKLCILGGKTAAEIQSLGECPCDPGGYFIIRGTERVLLIQEQLSNNRIIVELDAKKQVQAVVTSSTADNKSRTLVCSKHEGKDGLFVRHSAFTDLVPLVVVLKAMGAQSDLEIAQLIGDGAPHTNSGIILSLQDAHGCNVFSQREALDYLAEKLKLRYPSRPGQEKVDTRRAEVLDALIRQVLSHVEVGSGLDFSSKIRYLCLMARRVLDVRAGIGKLDDRDYYGNKRLELSGQLLSLLFEDLFKNFNIEVKIQMDKQLTKYNQSKASSAASARRLQPYPDCFQAVPSERISQGMAKAISTGNWNIKRFRIDLSGVSQVLSRFSFISALGAMTRIKSQFDKGVKVAGPRALQPSQWGMLCVSDTPEGEQCGLVKHLTLLAHVTTPDEDAGLRSLCLAFGAEEAGVLTGQELHRSVRVFINGALLGVARKPSKLIAALRLLRRTGKIGEFVSIYKDDAQNAIFISSDGGRLCRPLIVCEGGKSKITDEHIHGIKTGKFIFSDLLKLGLIEWMDVNEENDSFIALTLAEVTPEHTHLEIDPISLLGTVAGLIPYPHHNQSPRNTYQCAMGKQAMGAIAWNQWNRTDTLLLTLTYPQKPMCKTRTIDLIGWENLPAGQNASVAVMSFSGYDIEDAIVMNRASLDRGFGRCGYLRKYDTELAKVDTHFEDVQGPPVEQKTAGRHKSSASPGLLRKYATVDDDGTARVGDLISDGGILVNKMTPIVAASDMSGGSGPTGWTENPLRYKNAVESYVDRVIWTQDENQNIAIKVMMRQTRRPELGDKFSSRHGQKGVCGLIVPQEDMPFAETGWCPDLIMNPHGFPSRMTVGKMLELLGGKGGVLHGKQAYGTVFGGTSREEISEQLIAKGFHPSGKDILMSGITGEMLECYIFQGPIYYQKLKHMVVDKIHARSIGQRQGLTRQPTEGRARDGGLRLGEMERDCLVAYGASNLLLERLMLSSDVFNPPVCGKCGLIARANYCSLCKSGSEVVSIRMPYACKLLFQEMQGMNVCARLKIEHR